MNAPDALRPSLDRLQWIFLTVGALGGALCFLGAWLNPAQFYQSYLLGYLFWLGIALGCLGLTMLHHLVGGTWGYVIRRLLESGASHFWLMVLLFLPLLVGGDQLYRWARPGALEADPVIAHRVYFKLPFFVARAGVYFAVWTGLGFLLCRWSARQDETAEPALSERLQRLSGPGLALLFFTASFAAIDWVMSLEPDWYSTIYGAMLVTGQALETLAFATGAAILLSGHEPLASFASPARLRDLGNLMLAFVMLWAYMAFSQFLIIWCGDLKEEIPWYLRRTQGGWEWVGLFLIVFHFFLPFFALFFRDLKGNLRPLLVVAALILGMHAVDLYWLVVPPFRKSALALQWTDVVAPLAIGGIWLGAFVWQLKRRPLLPLHDPRLEEALQHAKGD
jgi:hypothetical protein